MSTIEIYRTKDKRTEVEVQFDDETVWLSQKQISDLFQKDVRTVSEHITNVYKEKELERNRTIRKFRIVQKEGKRTVNRAVECYNLDVIISVGYRVKSKQGTQFRQWATTRLKEYLVQGYTANEHRLKELHQSIRLITDIAVRRELSSDEAKAILSVVGDYIYALDLLDDYDHQRMTVTGTSDGIVHAISYDEALRIISKLRERFNGSSLFGKEKDSSLQSSLNTIFQTIGGKDAYPSKEEKAAHLLYFLVKNHSFTDGNKRIAAALFLWFMEKNKILYTPDGAKRIADNALVAITLLIAESNPVEKNTLTNVVTNLINKKNL